MNLVNSAIIFSNDFTQIVNFPTHIPDCDSQSTPFLNFFLSCDCSICNTMDYPLLGHFDHAVASVSIDFPSFSKGDARFIS